MKTFISTLVFIWSIMAYSQDGWNNQIPNSTYPGLMGVFALDQNNIWAVGYEGTILHSTNRGLNWELITSPTSVTLYAVEFINADTGWIVGDDDGSSSTILRTFDGGLNWELQDLQSAGANVPIWDVDFVTLNENGEMRGYFTGGLSHTWRTDDYGESFEHVYGECGEGNIMSCSIIDSITGWFVGTPSVTTNQSILFTDDGGLSWYDQINPTDEPLRGVSFANYERGIAVGLMGTILYTADGGENWEDRPNDGSIWNSVFMNNTGKVWTCGKNGDIAYSTDWGYTWKKQQSDVECTCWEVFFIDENEGWVVGGGFGYPGVILHTTNGGVLAGVDKHIVKDENYYLDQNQPNPFNLMTQIHYKIQKSNHINLTVFDIIGKEVRVLVNEYQKVDEYTVDFESGNLDNGIYFYQLKAGEKIISSRKMMLLK